MMREEDCGKDKNEQDLSDAETGTKKDSESSKSTGKTKKINTAKIIIKFCEYRKRILDAEFTE